MADRREKDHKKQLRPLKRLGIFRTSDAIAAGISQPTISRLVTKGVLTRLHHGLYLHPDAKIDPSDIDFAIACAKFGPSALIGGMTALYHYGLIAEVPDRIWVMVPHRLKTTLPTYRCIRTNHDPTKSVEDRRFYRISTIERTILEALRYSSKIGLGLAYRASKAALAKGRTTELRLFNAAKDLRLLKVLTKHWEAIASE